MTRRRRVAIIAILSSVAFVVIAGVLEGGARLLGYQARSVRRFYWLREYDPVLGWVYKPDSRFEVVTSRGVTHGSTDGEGFRPLVGGANDPAGPVILCLGDSFTFGGESPDDQTWPECLSRILAARGHPCRALNRGVSGYNSLQSLLLLRQTLSRDSRASKIRAVIYLSCFNDPYENFEEDRPHFEAADLKAGNPRVLPPRPSQLDRKRSLVRTIRDRSAFLNAIRPESVDFSAEAFRTGAKVNIGYFSPMFPPFLSSESFQEGMRYALRELKKECEARGVPLLVASCVVQPLDDPVARREFAGYVGWSATELEAQVAAYQASFQLVKRLVEETGSTYVELRGCLAGLSYRDSLASPANCHYSVASNERIAGVLADALQRHLGDRPK
ncbi:MAG TPA: GDSL-type esterase/lipase family protein [Planctomycetota bacterium]|nr:GDSL-type esterase/lipase family protein [Planctomycetota bacterium]